MSPWKVYKQGEKFCIHKKNADGSMGELVKGGCHATNKEALAQLRALYASEAKEITAETLDLLKEITDGEAEDKSEQALAVLDEWKARTEFDESIEEISEEKSVEQSEDDAEEKAKSFDIQERKYAIDHAWDEMFPPPRPVIQETGPDNRPWIVAYMDDSVIIYNDGKYYKATYSAKGDTVEIQDQSDWTEVVRESNWVSKAFTVTEDWEEKAKRSDVSAADRKRAEGKYGDVTYADETNKKYPIDTEEHIRAAWNYIRMPKNASKYPDNGAAIKRKIIAAWKKKIDSKGPPAAQKKDLLSKLKEIGEAVISWFKDEPEDQTGLSVWKEGNQYWWLARYSNKFRDSDNPPEIISSDSHKRFVELVKEGKAPKPELWAWHNKNWKVGRAHGVAYDDTGFAVAIGTFDTGKENVAKALMNTKEPIKLSHGMPISSIKRDEVDPTIIVEHETREISFLPAWAAANKLTGFAVLNLESKEESMAIPDETKQEWISNVGIDPETLNSLEEADTADADKAQSEGLESKEKEEEAQPATSETKTEVETEAKPDEKSVNEELLNAVKEAMTGILAPLTERLEALEKNLQTVKEASDKRDKALEGTPTASLSALLGDFAKSAIGAEENRVDGRTKLAQSKPKETAANAVGPTIVPFINDILAGNTQ